MVVVKSHTGFGKLLISLIVIVLLVLAFVIFDIETTFTHMALNAQNNAFKKFGVLLCTWNGREVKQWGQDQSYSCESPSYNPSEMIIRKPAIYLYPPNPINVSVSVMYSPGFSVTYPAYFTGWTVTAYPNGKLLNHHDGREYSYLYWEGNPDPSASYDLTRGFVVKGEDTAIFLQQKLEEIGLIPKEYNEFIVYWLPQMVHNPYNLIHFANDAEYGNKAQLVVSPTPDSVLRVFMVFKSLKHPIEVTSQLFTPFTRNGFTVVEWGGSELK
jgi:hypothetical protein